MKKQTNLDRIHSEGIHVVREADAVAIELPLRQAGHVRWHGMKIDKSIRSRMNRQKACVVWFTGLSGSGKSSIADRLEHRPTELSGGERQPNSWSMPG